ncbi:MAG: DUF167 domain-containing protein [Deltaproteobacteria bacterium]|nr:DUF167 domain-containing protein [Deltaproteobacteria bacterium]
MKVRVLPRSAHGGIVGIQQGAVKIKICSPPIDGRANEECRELIATALKIAKSNVSIVAGERARLKMVKIEGVAKKQAEEILGNLGNCGTKRK